MGGACPIVGIGEGVHLNGVRGSGGLAHLHGIRGPASLAHLNGTWSGLRGDACEALGFSVSGFRV